MANAQDPVPDRAISPRHCVACPTARARGGCFGRLWASEEKLQVEIAISKMLPKNPSISITYKITNAYAAELAKMVSEQTNTVDTLL